VNKTYKLEITFGPAPEMGFDQMSDQEIIESFEEVLRDAGFDNAGLLEVVLKDVEDEEIDLGR
jgi:hypothetical protein